MKVEHLKFNGKDGLSSGTFVEVEPGKFIAVFLGDGYYSFTDNEIKERYEVDANLYGNFVKKWLT